MSRYLIQADEVKDRIRAGEKPLRVSADKWSRAEDVLRDVLDNLESANTCGCCVKYHSNCDICPLRTNTGVCDSKNGTNWVLVTSLLSDAIRNVYLFKDGLTNLAIDEDRRREDEKHNRI